MSTTSGEAPAAPRFRLQTLGTLRLVGLADDTVLGNYGHQRRRLALLAVLAASGERGRSRDQLLGLFWPDVSQARARHSLEQLRYAIQTSLDGSVFIGGNPLRLNTAFISSDIGDFTDALARGALEAAVELYRGPFLEGFYLSDEPEFEQWLDGERGRIERSYTTALEMLAKSAEDANDAAAVARWLQKLIDTDPISSKHAIDLIRALMNAGDHAAALRYAERYETIVAQELGMSVGPAVADLVAEVRMRAKTESVVLHGAAPRPRRASGSALPGTPEHAFLGPSDAAEGTSEAPGSAGARADTPAAPENSSASESASPPITEPLVQRDGPLMLPLGAGRRLKASIYGVAALALTALVLAVWWLRSTVADAPAPPAVADASIAVLPLVNLSGDSRDLALVDGLSEELIGVLAKIDRLRVVARTSAFVFKNSTMNVRQIADSLRVSNVLEGGVQRVGQRIRVQVRLVNAQDGSTRWSETYDRSVKDIFLVQSEIAAAVARELDLRLVGHTVNAIRRGPTQNIAAYELYLRGNDPVLLRSDSSALQGVAYFRQAIALDSTYAAAYAGLARLYLRLRQAGSADSVRELHSLAKEAALKAVELDDSLAEAHAAVGALLMVRYDLRAAEKELKRAVAMDPGHSRTREWLAMLYSWTQRPADALVEANRAVENDPLSPSAHAEVALALCANRQYAGGLARLKRLEAVQPPLLRASLFAGLCHGMAQNWPEAVVALRESRGRQYRGFLGNALARAGKRQQALSILTDLTNQWERTKRGAFEIAIVHAGLGNRAEAFEWLNRSIDDFSLSPHIMLPLFDELHADPRFERFRRRLGL